MTDSEELQSAWDGKEWPKTAEHMIDKIFRDLSLNGISEGEAHEQVLEVFRAERQRIEAALKERNLYEPVTNKPVYGSGVKVTIDLDSDTKGSLKFIQDNGYNTAIREAKQAINNTGEAK